MIGGWEVRSKWKGVPRPGNRFVSFLRSSGGEASLRCERNELSVAKTNVLLGVPGCPVGCPGGVPVAPRPPWAVAQVCQLNRSNDTKAEKLDNDLKSQRLGRWNSGCLKDEDNPRAWIDRQLKDEGLLNLF